MSCEVLVSDEFRDWYEPLSEAEQLSVGRVVELLEEMGTALGFPYSSGIEGSKLGHLRELRVQHEGRPYRVLYAFDSSERISVARRGQDRQGPMVRDQHSLGGEHLCQAFGRAAMR